MKKVNKSKLAVALIACTAAIALDGVVVAREPAAYKPHVLPVLNRLPAPIGTHKKTCQGQR